VPVIVRELEVSTPALDDVVTEMACMITVIGSSAVPGFVIAADAIKPTLLLLPSSIAATTLTAGDA